MSRIFLNIGGPPGSGGAACCGRFDMYSFGIRRSVTRNEKRELVWIEIKTRSRWVWESMCNIPSGNSEMRGLFDALFATVSIVLVGGGMPWDIDIFAGTEIGADRYSTGTCGCTRTYGASRNGCNTHTQNQHFVIIECKWTIYDLISVFNSLCLTCIVPYGFCWTYLIDASRAGTLYDWGDAAGGGCGPLL